MHPDEAKEPGPPRFKLSEINRKSRAGIPITDEERAFRTEVHRNKYDPDKADFRPGRGLLEAWQPLWEGRGMNRSRWFTERIQLSLQDESPAVKEAREEARKAQAERDLLRSQVAELAVDRSQNQQRIKELEGTVNSLLAECIRSRGAQ